MKLFNIILLLYFVSSLIIVLFCKLPFDHEKEMQLVVEVKLLGKRKNSIEGKTITLEHIPCTTAELIREIVVLHVNEFNKRINEPNLLQYITVDTNNKFKEGKVSFGTVYNKVPAIAEEAVLNAFQSFKDGIFRIFIEEKELTSLEERVVISENDKLTFIRLTMLAGRMW